MFSLRGSRSSPSPASLALWGEPEGTEPQALGPTHVEWRSLSSHGGSITLCVLLPTIGANNLHPLATRRRSPAPRRGKP
eukprot:9281455-Pyramimonas_sp.AAC.1